MRLLKTNHNYYYLLIVASLVLILNFRGCKDLEDCRSIYTNETWIEFKGEKELILDLIEFNKPNKHPLYDKNTGYKNKKDEKVLSKLKNKSLPFRLHPKHNMITLLFYRNSTGPSSKPDTLTIFYKRIPSMLSPHCGLQEEYIIERVETTFAGSKIISPALRNKKYETDPEERKKPNIEIYY